MQCRRSRTIPGDGRDNDCDGKVDEERPAPGADKDVFDALFGGYVEPVLDDDEAIM